MATYRFPQVLFVVATLGQGGAERQLYEQCRILTAAGTRPIVVSFTKGQHWEQPLRDLGAEVLSLPPGARPLGILRGILSIATRTRPDVIQSTLTYTNPYASVVASLVGCPSIGALQNDPDVVAAELRPWLRRASFRKMTVLAGNARSQLSAATRYGARPERSFYLPNAVQVDRFPVVDRRGRPDVSVLFVGRLVEQKRPDLVIRTFGAARSMPGSPGDRTKLVLVGGGDLIPLKDLASSLGLADSIEFRAETEDVLGLYSEADVLLSMSDWEGTPNVVLEAMTTGLPVVATEVGAIPELITDHRNGRLVQPGDVEAAALALCDLIADPDERARLGAQAADDIRGRFSEELLEEAMCDLYRLARELHDDSAVSGRFVGGFLGRKSDAAEEPEVAE